jgi:hypothetical protein
MNSFITIENPTLDKIKEFIDFSIENQEGIIKEHYVNKLQWTLGYLECLNDIKRILNKDEE